MPRPGQARAEPKAPPFASGPGPTGDKLEGPAPGASPASISSGRRHRTGQPDGLPDSSPVRPGLPADPTSRVAFPGPGLPAPAAARRRPEARALDWELAAGLRAPARPLRSAPPGQKFGFLSLMPLW